MNKFYESDVAKRVVSTVPSITTEMTVIGQKWAMSVNSMIKEASK